MLSKVCQTCRFAGILDCSLKYSRVHLIVFLFDSCGDITSSLFNSLRKSSLDAGGISPVSVPISRKFVASISQRYYASSPNFCRRMAKTTPKKRGNGHFVVLNSNINRPSKLPPFFKSESWTWKTRLENLPLTGYLTKTC